ncbi:chemosensory receptor A [Elysia marginata]|uniref:Chemosensory receptor A n=1 Tax=Elysia marginata TaxID=1093978 RepID=A0AAV4I7Z9_9GAST|nr:chemosensory receptor A [Elysia marginata]
MTNITIQGAFLNENKTDSSSSSLAVSSHGDIPAGYFSLLMEYTSYTMIFVAAFGMAGNILIIITYAKIGFSEPINISYFALGISDIFCVTFLTWNAICFIPDFADSDVPFVSREIVIPTGGFTSDVFSKTTTWITAFISLERCLCVVFPLKIKTIVRRRTTCLVISTIFVLTVLPLTGIVSYTYVLDYRYDSANNRTVLGVSIRNSSLTESLASVNYIYKLVFLNIIPFTIILLSSIFLGIHLNRNASWRLGNSSQEAKTNTQASNNDDKAHRKYTKDMRVAKTVLAIALAFIFLGTLSTLRILIAMNWTDFRPIGSHARLFRFTARLAFLLSLANSSVNFVIYYRMGSKFRATVKEIVFLCRKKDTTP